MFDRECNNHGQCNMKAKTCVCDDGWYGAACERMDCPGEPDCSNNGQSYINTLTFHNSKCISFEAPRSTLHFDMFIKRLVSTRKHSDICLSVVFCRDNC